MAAKPDHARFVAETRMVPGRAEFSAWLAAQSAAETHTALYNRDPVGREIAAGRAQVWREVELLFASR